jgi:hypothetical protein
MHKNKAYPYPEIVTGESWEVLGTVHDSPQASTDNLNRQMTVPLDRECKECGVNHSRMVRRHELGHAKWSPKTMGKLKPGVRAEAIEVLEEIRINYLLRRSGLPINELMICKDTVEQKAMKLVYEGSLTSIILYGLSCMGYRPNANTNVLDYMAEFEELYKAMQIIQKDENVQELRKSEIAYASRVIRDYYYKITNHNYGQTISYRKVQKYAESLSKILDMFRDKPDPSEVFKPAPQPSAVESSENSETEDESELGPTESLENRTNRELKEMIYTSTEGIGRWGEMRMHEPPLTVNLQGRLKGGRAYRPADYGYNPKYINRYCVDKKIFKQKMTQLGGTILIDASGSMSFSGEDILEIMQMLPAVTIAMYNGRSVTGDLRIIARNGKRVNQSYLDRHSGYGNVVDGPALEWLGTQPAKRIWVSDMHVFGAYGDSSGFNLLQDVYKTCKKFNIINLKDIEEVKEHCLKLNM